MYRHIHCLQFSVKIASQSCCPLFHHLLPLPPPPHFQLHPHFSFAAMIVEEETEARRDFCCGSFKKHPRLPAGMVLGLQNESHTVATHQIQGAMYAWLLALNCCCHKNVRNLKMVIASQKKGRLGSMTCGHETQGLWESFPWPQSCACVLLLNLVCKLVSIQDLK